MIGTLIFAVLVSTVAANPTVRKTCTFPNSTDTNLHAYNCDGSQVMQITNTAILTQTNASMYPIDPRKPMYLDLTALNNGIVYTDNRVNVKIYDYAVNWLTGNCEWNEVPTFGLLSNIDGCDYAHNCPLNTGNLDLRLPLDLSPYAAIVNLLAGSSPYQLEVHMFDNNPGSKKEEIACVVVQLRFSEKS
uniref:ML domain-containing protein n=1 Tax=Panagrellus redivivus TaxID=6233 RepID=A0A7E4URV7_PANRE